jgi:hypothetical protein
MLPAPPTSIVVAVERVPILGPTGRSGFAAARRKECAVKRRSPVEVPAAPTSTLLIVDRDSTKRSVCTFSAASPGATMRPESGASASAMTVRKTRTPFLGKTIPFVQCGQARNEGHGPLNES